MAVPMARATIAQKTLLALESTYGVVPGSPAWKRLPTLAVKPRPNVEAMAYREQGRKFSSVVIPNREWSSATFEGAMTYSELPFIYSSLFSPPLAGSPLVITYPTIGTDGEYVWTMAPQNDAPDTPATFAMQHGDTSANGIQATGMAVTDATMDITRKECKLSGTMLGLPWTTGTTLAASPTDVENIPITAGSWTVYLDSTFGGIGTTKLAKFLSLQHQVQNRWGPEWVLDASQGSYVDLVELAPTSTVTLKMEADSQAMALFATYRAGSIAYLQAKSVGPVIAASTHYKVLLDIPVEIKELQEYTDEEGTYAIGFVMEPIADPGAGFPMQLQTTSKQAAI